MEMVDTRTVGLLERLDAIDRRLGVGRTPKRPPNRFVRWMARHPWWMALFYAAAIAVPIIVGDALDGFASLAFSVVVTALLSLPVGVGMALSARNAVERWDQETGDPDSETRPGSGAGMP